MPNNSVVVRWVPLSCLDNLKLLPYSLEGINVVAMVTVLTFQPENWKEDAADELADIILIAMHSQ